MTNVGLSNRSRAGVRPRIIRPVTTERQMRCGAEDPSRSPWSRGHLGPRTGLLALLAIGALLPLRATADDLGIASNYVHGTWTNINQALVTIAGYVSGDAAWREEIRRMAPRAFVGKRSADVHDQLAILRSKLDRFMLAARLSPSDASTESGSRSPPATWH